ncbi:MAG: translocation/assembly module TamB domain-containing protein [Thermodesulfobacteriota bacterium]
MDIQVRLLLGEKVYYRAEGIDVRLRGDLRLNIQDPSKISGIGEINLAQGHYTAYGHRLELIRGRIIFTGGPMENPNLDVLAVRKIKEVQAGVAVTGTFQKPVIRLYSRPSMPDTDILSYIVLGQPLGKGAEAAPSLIQAAGALLSAGESVILQGKLRKMFGLDTLDITTPPGEGEVSRSMVTIGKYLTPKLYISLGRSLFTDATLVTLRYTLSKRLEIETTTGTESGVTLFYKIEFR